MLSNLVERDSDSETDESESQGNLKVKPKKHGPALSCQDGEDV